MPTIVQVLFISINYGWDEKFNILRNILVVTELYLLNIANIKSLGNQHFSKFMHLACIGNLHFGEVNIDKFIIFPAIAKFEKQSLVLGLRYEIFRACLADIWSHLLEDSLLQDRPQCLLQILHTPLIVLLW